MCASLWLWYEEGKRLNGYVPWCFFQISFHFNIFFSVSVFHNFHFPSACQPYQKVDNVLETYNWVNCWMIFLWKLKKNQNKHAWHLFSVCQPMLLLKSGGRSGCLGEKRILPSFYLFMWVSPCSSSKLYIRAYMPLGIAVCLCLCLSLPSECASLW